MRTLTISQTIARAIKSRVDTFSDRRLNDGDDVWNARELELRCSVAATANAIAVEFADHDGNYEPFDVAAFAAACGLFVSDGRDTFSDCHPGELTWERPRDQGIVMPPTRPVADHVLQADLPAHNGWTSTYEFPGFISYTHPEGTVAVLASSDFNGDGKLDIQICTTNLARCLNDGENEAWPHEGRTAAALFARIRPYLDKYQPSAARVVSAP